VFRFSKHSAITRFLFLAAAVCSCFSIFCSSNTTSVEKGNVSLRLGDYAMAQRFFEKVLTENPDNYDARLGMGKALIQQAAAQQNDSIAWSKAIIHLEAARTLRPQNDIELLLSDAWTVHARQCLKSHDTITALLSLSKAIDYNPKSVDALNTAGILYFRAGETDKSGLLFKRALAIDTTRPYTYFNIGMVYWSLGNTADANNAWFKAVQLAPDDKDIVYWYALSEKSLLEAKR